MPSGSAMNVTDRAVGGDLRAEVLAAAGTPESAATVAVARSSRASRSGPGSSVLEVRAEPLGDEDHRLAVGRERRLEIREGVVVSRSSCPVSSVQPIEIDQPAAIAAERPSTVPSGANAGLQRIVEARQRAPRA